MKRLQALAVLAVTATLASPVLAADGKEVYNANCAMCHAAGVANAPKFGDKAAWGPRVATGKDALVKAAVGGKNAMPAKGGNAKLSDDDVKAAVEFMLDAVK